ncbi:MAG: hypothetical protein E6K18_03485 [Methanobacteriota archaeon]|nr:MAG: hypothetical protein E6K18_03485 [Euryarchaeota archaeon]
MAFQIPAKVEAVFGSQTRAKVLGYLAGLSVPQTGYAISKNLDIGVSKVYEELKRLEAGGVILSDFDVRGSKRFWLNDEDLRSFLARNMRILPAGDWFSPGRIAERREKFAETSRVRVDLPSVPARDGTPPFAKEFRRTPAKDRALRRIRGGSVRPQ